MDWTRWLKRNRPRRSSDRQAEQEVPQETLEASQAVVRRLPAEEVSIRTSDGWYIRASDERIASVPGLRFNESAIWRGEPIVHVYRRERDGSIEQCPRCGGKLEHKYVGLVYASTGQLRQSASPCAFICHACRLAVIDKQLPERTAHEQGYDYLFPVGMYRLDQPVPPLEDLRIFETYEGHEPMFLLDEDEKMEDVLYADQVGPLDRIGGWLDPPSPSVSKVRKRRKQKLQKQARKRNRRRA
jgi:hypothetical protein